MTALDDKAGEGEVYDYTGQHPIVTMRFYLGAEEQDRLSAWFFETRIRWRPDGHLVTRDDIKGTPLGLFDAVEGALSAFVDQPHSAQLRQAVYATVRLALACLPALPGLGGSTTGRFGSSEPNIQNVARRTTVVDEEDT